MQGAQNTTRPTAESFISLLLLPLFPFDRIDLAWDVIVRFAVTEVNGQHLPNEFYLGEHVVETNPGRVSKLNTNSLLFPFLLFSIRLGQGKTFSLFLSLLISFTSSRRTSVSFN